MIKTLVLDRTVERHSRTDCPTEKISDLCGSPDKILWVDVANPTGQDFEDLAAEFGLHPLSIEDCRHPHQRPKVEEFPGYYFIVLYEAELTEERDLDLRELNIFLGKNDLGSIRTASDSSHEQGPTCMNIMSV